MDNDILQPADTLTEPGKPNSSKVVLESLNDAERAMRDYNELARRIDMVYSARSDLSASIADIGMGDQEYDTFWAAMEVLKPAIYAKPPRVVAKPRFSDASPTDKVVAELIERVVNSEFERSNIDQHLKEVRDDLALLNRGVLRVTLEEKRLCIDHVDRLDFRHDNARYWYENTWEGFCAWMTETEMKDRFEKHSGNAYTRAGFAARQTKWDDDFGDESMKAPVWEVWSKSDNKVYWVTEGVDVMLDEAAPHLGLADFFPAPKPAYGTLRRRSLIPVPDYVRYVRHLDQINTITSKIYTLIERVRLMGFIAGGGDVATAAATMLSGDETVILVPVPGAALMASGGSAQIVQWLPLTDIAAAITGLIEARSQIFSDFDRLSGISDIMRGETEAEETLGAQRLKGQYGSVRIKDKTDEIVRLARDTARIAVEIICREFDQKTLLEIAQMDIPTRAQVTKDIEALRRAAKAEMEALGEKAQEAASKAQQSGEQVDPAQAQQQLQQAQAALVAKYAPQFQKLQNTVVIDDVMEIIKDKRERALVIDIETDSTVMVDEIAEKQMRNELLSAFSGAMQQLLPMFSLGDAAVKLAMGMLQFTVDPYVKGNRTLQGLFDDLVDQAPEIAKQMQAQQGQQGDSDALVEAQKGLAEAEKVKAQAALAGVQAKSELDKAELQRKVAQMQIDAQQAQAKNQHDMGALQLKYTEAQTKATQAQEMQQAQIDNLTAKTAEILNKMHLDVRKQELSEYTAANNAQAQQVDQSLAIEGKQQDAQFRSAEHERANRGEDRADQAQEYTQRSGDRAADFAETQAERGDD